MVDYGRAKTQVVHARATLPLDATNQFAMDGIVDENRHCGNWPST